MLVSVDEHSDGHKQMQNSYAYKHMVFGRGGRLSLPLQYEAFRNSMLPQIVNTAVVVPRLARNALETLGYQFKSYSVFTYMREYLGFVLRWSQNRSHFHNNPKRKCLGDLS